MVSFECKQYELYRSNKDDYSLFLLDSIVLFQWNNLCSFWFDSTAYVAKINNRKCNQNVGLFHETITSYLVYFHLFTFASANAAQWAHSCHCAPVYVPHTHSVSTIYMSIAFYHAHFIWKTYLPTRNDCELYNVLSFYLFLSTFIVWIYYFTSNCSEHKKILHLPTHIRSHTETNKQTNNQMNKQTKYKKSNGMNKRSER